MLDNTKNSPAFGARARGFAGLDPERRREIAREGGRAAHEKGTAHQFSPEEARAAALKSRIGRQKKSDAGPSAPNAGTPANEPAGSAST